MARDAPWLSAFPSTAAAWTGPALPRHPPEPTRYSPRALATAGAVGLTRGAPSAGCYAMHASAECNSSDSLCAARLNRELSAHENGGEALQSGGRSSAGLLHSARGYMGKLHPCDNRRDNKLV